MANQVTVSNNNTINVTIEPPANVQVQVSRAVIGTVANVASADLANYVIQPNQSNITSVGTLTGLTSSGNIIAPFFIGNVVGNISGNFAVPGNNTAVLFNQTGNAGASDALTFNYSSNVLTANGNIVANYFIGNGSQLTGIITQQSNVANYANVANSVAGANVTGAVAYATTANSVALANVAGAGNIASININGNASQILYGNGIFAAVPNVSNVANANYASYAGEAFSVSASNIVGTVNLANFATTANSVAGANVSGAVSYATTANAVAGANVSGTVANATYAATSGSATTAGTVTTNAQPNITSVGTLTGLVVSGNITPSANITYSLGNNTNRFSNLYLAGNTIVLGAQELSANAGGISFSGNLTGDASGLSNIVGANVTGQVANALIAGTVYTNAQPNITSVGNLTSVTVSGDAGIAGNLTVGGNISYVNVNNLVVQDPVIELGGGPNGAPLTTNDGKDRGTLLHYYTTQPIDAFMGWDNSNGEFAFGSNVTNNLDVMTFNTLGNVRAQTFIGNLTGLASSATVAASANAVAGANVSGAVAYATTANSVAVANVSGIGNIATVNLDGNAGNILYGNGVFATISIPSGTSISNGTSNVNIPTVNGNVNISSGGYPNVMVVTTGGAYVNGLVEASRFISNVGTGTAPFTVTSTTQVANLNVATAGLATFATTANAVAGANVSGAVAFATTANSVAVANVSGLGNIATTNYDGNASNVLYGNGNFYALPTVSNVANANYSNFAGTVITNAQPNITSVGNLANLTVTGDITSTSIISPVGGGANIDISPDGIGHVNLNADTVRIGDNNTDASIWTRGTGNLTLKTHDVEANESNITIVNGATGNIQLNPKGIVVTTSNVQANYFIGNGSSLTSITGGNVTGAVAYATTANAVAGSNVSGQVGYAAVANSVAVANVVGIGNIATTNFNGNGSQALLGNGVFGAVSSTTVAGSNTQIQYNNNGNLGANSYFTFDTPTATLNVGSATDQLYPGTINVKAKGLIGSSTGTIAITPNSISRTTAFSFPANANISGFNVISYGAGPNNITLTSDGNATIGNNFTVTGNANVGNLGTTTVIATGNISATQLISNISTGTAPLIVTSTTEVANLNVAKASLATFATTANAVAGANVSGAVAFATTANSVALANVSGAGNIASINLDGSSSNVLYGNGVFAAGGGGGGTPGGSNTQLQFNNAGSFGGISTVTWNGSNISLGAVGTVKVTGGVNNEVIRTDGTGNLSFSSIAQTLLVGTRAGPYTVPITNYTFQVTTRSSGNVTVYVN